MKYFGLLIVCLTFFPFTTFAATLYMDPQSATLHRGDAVTVTIRLDTDESINECVNAVEAVIAFSPSVIPVDISTGNSIFSMWVERPTINRESNTISFAGGIPNGYCGRVAGDPRLTNVIAELVFRAPGLQVGGGELNNQAIVEFTEQTVVYTNDGFGTRAPLRTFGTTLALLDTIGPEIKDDWRTQVQNDTIPPEPFSIELVFGQTAKGEKYYIVFSTSDKQTGISHYEVLEERTEDASWFSFGAATAPWVTVPGPVYILSDQTLSSIIRVKAVDKAGNEYLTSLQPSRQMNDNTADILLYVLGGLALFMAIGAVLLVIRKLQRVRTLSKSSSEDNQILL